MKNEKKPRKLLYLIPYILIPVLVIGAFMFFSGDNSKDKTEYYEIVNLFDEGKVESYSLNLSSGLLKYQLKGDKKEYKYTVPNVNLFVSDVHETVREYNESVENEKDLVKMEYVPGSQNSWLTNMLPTILLIGITVLLMFLMMRRMNQSLSNENNRTMSFGKAKAKQAKDDKRKTTFKDVAGADEEKEELAEIVEFLKNPTKFNDLGARIPKGVLLVGPPGTGKTLLARAVAGEADAPFFSISGSDFVEMYVGVGASRVRDLFAQAKKNSPAIIFIDEIDAVGRHRGAGLGGGHDEREQTLNQLLVEMDGFGGNESIIILAATNRPDILDPALLRPGRFDRQITVGRPDIKGREEILKVHAKKKPLAPDVDLAVIARSTAGFTGADLENLLNEAALLTARRNKKSITMDEIEEATIKVVAGTEKKSHKITDKDKKLTAYHEAGHAIATYYLPGQDPVHQISIIPRGMAGGYTMSLPSEDKNYITKNYMEDEIVTLLGGRIAEALVLDDISTGASNDIQRATQLAHSMVVKYGMSKTVGPIFYGSDNDEVFLGRSYASSKNYSEETASKIDAEVKKIISDAYKRCEKILKTHRAQLDLVAKDLFVNEKIDAERFESLMKGEISIDDINIESPVVKNTDDSQTEE
ncbi:MAG: ATP-dependent zinc metalloprotease FtsH [Clostridia bacterium]|nr:ATP-dependent zinc metalloprotease FtsH [Clostridia bacterium]